jgi:hypothetical protein
LYSGWFVLGAGYDKLLKVARPIAAFLTQTQQPAKELRYLHRELIGLVTGDFTH